MKRLSAMSDSEASDMVDVREVRTRSGKEADGRTNARKGMRSRWMGGRNERKGNRKVNKGTISADLNTMSRVGAGHAVWHLDR